MPIARHLEQRVPERQDAITSSARQTEALGARLALTLVGAAPAPRLSAAVVVLLKGELGAGKTTFVRGFVRELAGGSDIVVQSPTFALARRYHTTPPVQHLDLYRFYGQPDAAAAVRDLGLDHDEYDAHEDNGDNNDDANDDANDHANDLGITFVEWPLPGTWPKAVCVELVILSARRRRVRIELP